MNKYTKRKEALSLNLHRFMLRKQMNQSDLARRSGLSQPTISRLLSGASIPNVLVIAQMADALAFNDKKVTVDQLLRFRKSGAK